MFSSYSHKSQINFYLGFHFIIPERYLLIYNKIDKMSCCCGRRKLNTNGKFKSAFNFIVNAENKQCIAINQDPKADNQAILFDLNRTDIEKFSIKQKGPDCFLKCKKGGLYLTVEGPFTGARVYGTSKDMGESQRFRLQQVGEIENVMRIGSSMQKNDKIYKYVIYTFYGKVLGLENEKGGQGARIKQYDYNEKQYQHWLIQSSPEDEASDSSENEK